MQMHIGGDKPPSKEKVVKNMKRIGELGLKVYVTEFDVNMHGVKGSKDKKELIQAKIYGDMLSACLEVGAKTCPNFGYLGLTDRQTWYHGIGIDDGNPLMFDDDFNPKQAFFQVRKALENQ